MGVVKSFCDAQFNRRSNDAQSMGDTINRLSE